MSWQNLRAPFGIAIAEGKPFSALFAVEPRSAADRGLALLALRPLTTNVLGGRGTLDDAPDFVEGDRATRLKLLGFARVLLLLILFERLTSPDRGMLATDPAQALKKSADRLFHVVLVAVPLFVNVSIYLLRLAVKVRRSSQWPRRECEWPSEPGFAAAGAPSGTQR